MLIGCPLARSGASSVRQVGLGSLLEVRCAPEGHPGLWFASLFSRAAGGRGYFFAAFASLVACVSSRDPAHHDGHHEGKRGEGQS